MKTRVLIVEDNATNLMMLQLLVGQVAGCEAIGFDDPLVAAVRLSDLNYDIALVDYQMPGMDGVALIRAMRAAAGYADQPILMITADTEKSIAGCASCGRDRTSHSIVEFPAQADRCARISAGASRTSSG